MTNIKNNLFVFAVNIARYIYIYIYITYDFIKPPDFMICILLQNNILFYFLNLCI